MHRLIVKRVKKTSSAPQKSYWRLYGVKLGGGSGRVEDDAEVIGTAIWHWMVCIISKKRLANLQGVLKRIAILVAISGCPRSTTRSQPDRGIGVAPKAIAASAIQPPIINSIFIFVSTTPHLSSIDPLT
jgi:hypothetical protein